jgi:hypothetical protein
MIRTMMRTARLVRRLRQQDLRTYVQGYLDEALASHGYVRRPTGLASSLPMIGAFGAGVAVGTGVGMLIAPASGAETRAKVRAELEAWLARARERARKEQAEATGEAGEAKAASSAPHIITDDPSITHEQPMRQS